MIKKLLIALSLIFLLTGISEAGRQQDIQQRGRSSRTIKKSAGTPRVPISEHVIDRDTDNTIIGVGVNPSGTTDGYLLKYRDEDDAGTTVYWEISNSIGSDIAVELPVLGTPTYDSLQDLINNTLSSGYFGGGAITDSGSGQIDVASGYGYIRADSGETTELMAFDWTGETDIDLTNDSLNYVYVDYNSGTPDIAVTADVTSLNHTSQFVIGMVYREDTDIHVAQTGQKLDNFIHNLYYYFFEVEGIKRASGIATSETGTRNIAITSGVMTWALQRTATAEVNTSTTGTFGYYYNNGSWQLVSGETQINNLQYNNYGVGLATLTAQRYGVHWVFMTIDGDVYVVYGKGDYTLAQAQAAAVPSTLPNELISIAIPIAKVIIQKSASSFTSVSLPWTANIGFSPASDHGSLAGLSDNDHTQYVLHTEVDDIAVNGETDPISSNWAYDHKNGVDEHTGYVLESLFDAQTVLQATSDNTPTALTITEQTLVGRLTSGNISAVAIGISDNNIVQIDDADAADNDYMKLTATGLEGMSYQGASTDILSVTLRENTSIKLDPSLSADGKYSGITITGTTGSGATVAFGDLIFLNNADTTWEFADADSGESAYTLIGMCVAAANQNATTTILLQGHIRADTAFPALTVGYPVFIGTTAGDIVTTAPSGASDIIRVMGHATTADSLYFNPAGTWIEHN